MKNLIDKFIKKSKFRITSKIDDTSSKTMNDVLRPIKNLSILIGLRVIEFPRGHSRPILSFVYSMSLFFLYCYCWSYRELKIPKLFHFQGYLDKVFTSISHIMIFIVLIMRLYQTEPLKLCIKKINEIDKTLRELGSSSYFDDIYNRTIREITITFIYMLIIFIIISSGTVLQDSLHDTYISFFVCLLLAQYIYSFLIQFLSMMEFLTVVRCLKSEFQRGNELLSDVNVLPISSIASELIDRKENDSSLSIERTLPVNSKKLFISQSSSRQMQSRSQVASHKINKSRLLLRTIRQVHLELYRLSKSISEIYGIQISLEMAMCVLCNTYLLYDFYGKYMEKLYSIMTLTFQFVITTLCFIQYSLRIFIVNYVCDSTTNEAKRTNEIIHTFYGKNTDVEIQREVEIFSVQMMQLRTEYSAFGLYNLNCKQICACIGIITTYLVILIQVADSLKKE